MFIKNPALAETIARTLHTTPDQLTKEDMKELIQLDASNLETDTLDGLEYAENLERLNVSNNALKDIHPLEHLNNLEDLDLSGNRLRDITPSTTIFSCAD